MTNSSSQPLDRFHIVLVEPRESLNVGSVARAMANLGFRHLHLVAPRQYDPARARITACAAENLLESLVIHERFDEAVSAMEAVVGLALRKDESGPQFITLPAWTRALPAAARPLPVTALVFGPEDNGLRQEHLDHCRRVIRIPSTQTFSSFNLAQSVLLVLYEITKAFPAGEAETALLPPLEEAAAPTWNDYFQLDRLLDSVMAESGFVRSGTAPRTAGAIRNLFRRVPLTGREMGLLMALFGRLNTTLLRQSRESKKEE